MQAAVSTLACDDNAWDNAAILDKFLRGELAALASYALALSRVRGPLQRGVLLRCRASHRQRADLLAEQVRLFGGRPSRRGGPWSWFASAVETGAALLGEQSAIRALYEGELHGLHAYMGDVERLSGAARRFALQRVLPEQRVTARAVGDLARVG